jgi:hypothetical protein
MIKRLSSKGEAWQGTANLRKLAQLFPHLMSMYLQKVAATESLSEAAAKARAMKNLRLLGLATGTGLGVGAGAALLQRLSQSMAQGDATAQHSRLLKYVTEPVKMYVEKKPKGKDEDDSRYRKQSDLMEAGLERTPLSWDSANVALALLGGGLGAGVGYASADQLWKSYRRWRRNRKVEKEKRQYEQTLLEAGKREDQPKSASAHHLRAKLDEVVGQIFDEMEKSAWSATGSDLTSRAVDLLGKYYLGLGALGLLGGFGMGMHYGGQNSTRDALNKAILQHMMQKSPSGLPAVQIEEVEPKKKVKKKQIAE